MSTEQKWAPNDDHTLLDKVKEILHNLSSNEEKIVTSRDPAAKGLRDKLRTDTAAKGWEQWYLPIVLNGREMMWFIIVGHPNAVLPLHNHPNDALFRLIVSGEIIYDGKELGLGDWMYVPKGKHYTLQAGPHGVVTSHLVLFDPKDRPVK